MTHGYPTPEVVEQANARQLMTWMRYLPSPDDEARPTMDLILERYEELKVADPGAMVAASKAVGW